MEKDCTITSSSPYSFPAEFGADALQQEHYRSPTNVRTLTPNSNKQRQGIIVAMVSCLLLFLTAYGIFGLVQQIGICRLKEKIRKGSDILEAGNYWRIYFADRKHLDIGCYYICKQLSYQRVVNSPGKLLTQIAESNLTVWFGISIAMVALGIVLMAIEYFKKDN